MDFIPWGEEVEKDDRKGIILSAVGYTKDDQGTTWYVTPSTEELSGGVHHYNHDQDEVDPGLSHHTNYVTKEGLVVLCVVVLILLVAAKYIGCNLCPCLFKKKKFYTDNTYRPNRRDNVLDRPHFNGGLQYATYSVSRPTSGIATIDSQGYGLGGGFDDGSNDAKSFSAGTHPAILDPTLTAPATFGGTNYNYYTYGDTKSSGRDVGDVGL